MLGLAVPGTWLLFIMAGIAFYFEDYDLDVYSGRAIDLAAWYLASLIPGDIDKMIVVNKTGARVPLPTVENLDFRVVDELPELENAVYLDIHAGTPLYELDHSRVDWYVFGPAYGWRVAAANNQFDMEGKQYVTIPQASVRIPHCHAQHVVSTVMFHRYYSLRS